MVKETNSRKTMNNHSQISFHKNNGVVVLTKVVFGTKQLVVVDRNGPCQVEGQERGQCFPCPPSGTSNIRFVDSRYRVAEFDAMQIGSRYHITLDRLDTVSPSCMLWRLASLMGVTLDNLSSSTIKLLTLLRPVPNYPAMNEQIPGYHHCLNADNEPSCAV